LFLAYVGAVDTSSSVSLQNRTCEAVEYEARESSGSEGDEEEEEEENVEEEEEKEEKKRHYQAVMEKEKV